MCRGGGEKPNYTQFILQRGSNRLFQRKQKIGGRGVQFFPGGGSLMLLPMETYSTWFSRVGGPDP